MFQRPWGPGSLFQPQPSYCSHHHSKHATLLCCYISSSSVRPLPPTGHPEACWNTMPVLAQAPTSGPNVEVTSSGKNGIVSMESSTPSKHWSAANSCAEIRSKKNFSSNKDYCEGVATQYVIEHEVSRDGGGDKTLCQHRFSVEFYLTV